MIELLLLSFVQGVAEFLPISSSSHLILISTYFNFENQSLSLDVSLHIGSFVAVIVYFYKDLINFYENKTLFLKILLSSIPVIVTGYILIKTGQIDKIRNLETIAWTTLIFGILLYISDKFKLQKNIKEDFSFKSAIFIGTLQILSLFPGVSRSGIAITAARFLDFKRTDAGKISFLISIPILGAVSAYGFLNIFLSEDKNFTQINLLAILLSFIFSFLTIKFFLKYISRFNLSIFVIYRILIGALLLKLAYL